MSSSSSQSLPDQLWRPLTQHQALMGKPSHFMVEAKGCYLTDQDGKSYLDTMAGLWCVNVGYGRQELADVAQAQMARLPYLNPMMTAEPTATFANTIQELLGFKGHVYFSVSGSEANETAIKIPWEPWRPRGRASGRSATSRVRRASST